MVSTSRVARASMTNWSEGVDSKIFLARAVSSIFIWKSGRSTWKELSSEVSTMSSLESASAGPIAVPGMWFQTRL